MKAPKRICQLCNEDAPIIAGAFAFCSEAHRERWERWDKREPKRATCPAHVGEPEPCATCAAYIAAGL